MQKFTVLIFALVLFFSFLFLSTQHVSAYSFQFAWPQWPSVPTAPAVPTIPTFPTRIFVRPITQSVSPTVTPRPTRQPTPTPTSFIPTATPKPTATPTPRSTATSPSQPQSVSLDAKQQFMLNAINSYRASKGLSAVSSDHYTCSFAATRASEIVNGFNHDGFNNRVSGHTLPYPSYREVTENIAETGNYQDVVNLWINSPTHAANMQKDTPYVCVAYSGNFYAYEGWKP